MPQMVPTEIQISMICCSPSMLLPEYDNRRQDTKQEFVLFCFKFILFIYLLNNAL